MKNHDEIPIVVFNDEYLDGVINDLYYNHIADIVETSTIKFVQNFIDYCMLNCEKVIMAQDNLVTNDKSLMLAIQKYYKKTNGDILRNRIWNASLSINRGLTMLNTPTTDEVTKFYNNHEPIIFQMKDNKFFMLAFECAPIDLGTTKFLRFLVYLEIYWVNDEHTYIASNYDIPLHHTDEIRFPILIEGCNEILTSEQKCWLLLNGVKI